MRKALRVHYDCGNCPAWCCSYTSIFVNASDMKRIAKHFGISAREAAKRFTKEDPEDPRRVMRHQKDEHFGSVCRFLDTETRRCTIYEARPLGCRTYPGTSRCGYYDYLMAERDRQRDDKLVVTTDHR